MPVCNFFLQGRCRYGDKCWNEHPRGGNRGGGGGGGYNNNNNYNRSSAPQQPRGGGGGGFGNRVWVNPSQQKGGYIQPSSFSKGSDDWGGGRRDNVKASEFSFSSQNRFSSLGSPSTFDRGGRGGGGQQLVSVDEDADKKLEMIQLDMDIWESSGQWGFSCYSNSKSSLSGFTDLSPEELRLEFYTTRASGDLQSYLAGVSQLLSQWRSRVQELKVMNPATRAALLAELNNPAPQASSDGFNSGTASGFGSSSSGFGSKGFGSAAPAQASTFSFAAAGGGFGSSAAPSPSSTGFGSAIAPPTQPPSGFGSSSSAASAVSPSSFSFTTKPASAPAATTGFGSASGFSFSSTASTGGGFGSGFGAGAPVASSGSGGGFGQPAPSAAGSGSASGASDSLFSQESDLTPEELDQFKAKKFTLGQIPLKPPPANMLVV
ncbi:nucleoporin NUP42 [Halichoeres trimaculatus]|uniref:nucleoporin NUP42 n=1 Tax=Halichoeres trimaculatus TaxID=147232 RepID=UPI003D9E9DE9